MKIVLLGTPIAKKRHRCTCFGNVPRAYDPQVKDEMQAVKNQIQWQFSNVIEEENKQIVKKALNSSLDASYTVSLMFLFPIKDNEALAQRNAKLWGFKCHTEKPDIDNLEKFYLDCATGILWPDDSKIVVINANKNYDLNPRTEIDFMIQHPIEFTKKSCAFEVITPFRFKEFLQDLTAFWPWDPERIDQIISAKDSEALMAASCVMTELALKYADDFRKIQQRVNKQK